MLLRGAGLGMNMKTEKPMRAGNSRSDVAVEGLGGAVVCATFCQKGPLFLR